jgi:hypothetical protein
MNILMITGIEGANNCAAQLKSQLGMEVEVCNGRRSALVALRRREYVVVIVDDRLVEFDSDAADVIWENSGPAIPLQVNFALAGAARIIREIRAALRRREREQKAAQCAATADIEFALKDVVSGLWLQSQLALAEPGIPTPVASKLRVVADLAGTLRHRLSELPQALHRPVG